MTALLRGLDALRAEVSGPVIGPGDAAFDEARRVWNADVVRDPAVIVRCRRTADVVAALHFARAVGVRATVRGGAHATGGHAVSDGDLMIDLSPMRDVVVDPVARRAHVGGGALLADLDAATQAHGLAVPAGMVSHTGVGGLTLGGGMGWLTRRHGLTVDNLLSAEVVTADGTIRTASAEDHPDLFWALRGGGGGFGVVTRFELALHPLPSPVDFGLFFFAADRGHHALRLARDVMADLPRDLHLVTVAMSAPPAPFVPDEHRGAPGWSLLLAGFGDADGHDHGTHAAVVERIRAGAPDFERVAPMPYLALQQLIDEGGSAWGVHCYDKGAYLDGFTDAAVDVLVDGLVSKRSPLSIVSVYMLDEAYTEVADADTAFGGGRSPRLSVFVVGVSGDDGGLPAERSWVRALHAGLAVVGHGAAAYLNSETEPDEAALRATFGWKYARLAEIRGRYDPVGLLRGRTPGPAVPLMW